MNYSIISRADIIDFLEDSYEIPKTIIKCEKIYSIAESLKHDQVLLLWKEPRAIFVSPTWFVPDENYEELLAYVSTYISTYLPFTAFFRIVPLSFLRLIQPHRNPNKDYEKLIGVAIAESFFHNPPKLAVTNLHVQDVMKTISSAIISALHKGYGIKDIEVVIKQLLITRRLTNDKSFAVNDKLIVDFWLTVCVILKNEKSSPLQELQLPIHFIVAIQEILKSGEIHIESWKRLSGSSNDFEKVFYSFVGPKEDAVKAFQIFFRELILSNQFDENERQVIFGAAMSIISVGSFSLMNWALEYANRYPLIPFWYALFCGHHSCSDLKTFGPGLMRHVTKKVINNGTIFDPPDFDISFNELKMLQQSTTSLPTFWVADKSVIKVEVYPLVTCTFTNNKQQHDKEIINEPLFSSADINNLKGLLGSALKIIENKSNKPVQRNLYGDALKSSGSNTINGENRLINHNKNISSRKERK